MIGGSSRELCPSGCPRPAPTSVPGSTASGSPWSWPTPSSPRSSPTGSRCASRARAADEVPLDERHLVVRSMRATFAAMDVSPPGLHLACTNRIPHSRGLGSSSAAIVGGIVLARALVEGGADAFDDAAALSLASLIEGHPDNVAPALLGGFVISGRTGDEVWAQQSPVDPSISAVVFVPPHGVRTEVARGLLPETVPHADAAANSGRAALLVAALGGTPRAALARHRGLPAPAATSARDAGVARPGGRAARAPRSGRRFRGRSDGARLRHRRRRGRGRARSCRVAGDAPGSRWPRCRRVNVTAPHDPPPGSKHRSRRTARHQRRHPPGTRHVCVRSPPGTGTTATAQLAALAAQPTRGKDPE